MASMRRSFTRELAVLESRHSERAKAAERTAKEMAREGVRRELIARARAKGLPRHLGLGAVRDLLIGAEHGLGINRLSLEFRPLQASGFPSNGSQVSATLGGSFEGLFDYLDRIRTLVADGRNIVLVTHLLNEIPPDIDRVILLRQGTIVADGHKDDVLTSEHLSQAYEINVRVTRVGGYFLAYPP